MHNIMEICAEPYGNLLYSRTPPFQPFFLYIVWPVFIFYINMVIKHIRFRKNYNECVFIIIYTISKRIIIGIEIYSLVLENIKTLLDVTTMAIYIRG